VSKKVRLGTRQRVDPKPKAKAPLTTIKPRQKSQMDRGLCIVEKRIGIDVNLHENLLSSVRLVASFWLAVKYRNSRSLFYFQFS
jgi:hypothetical protein